VLTLTVGKRQHLVRGPVQVVGKEGYLLGQPLRGVAQDSPTGLASTSNSCVQ